MLDGSALNGRFWVFLAAATDVEYTVRVEDLVGETVWQHTNRLGTISAGDDVPLLRRRDGLCLPPAVRAFALSTP